MNKIFIYARPNKDFLHEVQMCFSSFFLSTNYPKIDGHDIKLSSIFGAELVATQPTTKAEKMFRKQ